MNPPMTDYTDLIVKVRMIASILRPLPNIRLDECDALDEAAAAIAALTVERDALQAHIAQEAEFLATVTAAKHAAEVEIARVKAIAEIALDNWASWVHDQLDGTGALADAISEVDDTRAALTAPKGE